MACIIVALAGDALGRLLGYGAALVLVAMPDGWGSYGTFGVVSLNIFMSVVFALQIFVLLGWFLWLVWRPLPKGRRKRSEEQLTPADPDAAAELEC